MLKTLGLRPFNKHRLGCVLLKQDEVHFNENKIRMMTLCSEPISSTMVAETNGSTCTNQSENEDHHAM